jgi:methionyl-tRNA synthetase
MDHWWKNPEEVELFQFIGKDNIPFHTVIFPSSLQGTGDTWTMLHHMSSTEYLNYESGKFSKSKGMGVFGTDVMETGIPADVWRFYIFYNRPEKADAIFTWKDFQEKVNGELIGNLGNLVNRTLTFVTRYYNGTIPGQGSGQGIPLNPELAAFRETVRRLEANITEKFERAELRDAFRGVFELSSVANKTFQEAEPWRKRTEDPPAAEALIRELSYLVRDIAVMLEPFMPAAARQIASFFGLSIGGKDAFGKPVQGEGEILSGEILSGKTLSWAVLGRDEGLPGPVTSAVLFARLEDPMVEALRDRYSGSQKDRADRFGQTLDLRVAQIVKIERHPQADKLYIETLEIEGEERVIVSGLVPFYTEEELLNKRIIVAYNLKPVKLRGVESRGMLLAASMNREDGSEVVEVLDAGDVPTGTRVELAGCGPGAPPAEIDIDAFFTVPLLVRDYTVEAGGKALTLQGQPIRTKAVAAGGVH